LTFPARFFNLAIGRLLRKLGCALWLVLGLICQPAWASASGEWLIDRAYWLDPSGQASLSQAKTQTLTPFEGIFSRGYSDGTHWLRLTLAASDEALAMRLSPTWVDAITLFDPAQPGELLSAGDRHPLGVTATPGLAYSFVLPASAEPRTLWLQLKSTNSHRLNIEVVPAHRLQEVNNHGMVWTSLYAALLLLMLLALLSAWWVQPDAVLGTYLVRHLNYMFYGVTYLGLTGLLLPQDWLPNGWLDWAFSMSVVLTLPLGLWFDIRLLSTYRPHRLWLRSLQVMAWGSLFMVALMLAGQARWALQLTVQLMMLAVLLLFAAAWSSQPDPRVEHLMPKRVLLAYYALVLGSLLIGLLTVQGWTSPQSWSNYLLVLHGLITGLIMTVILFVRGLRQFRHSQQVQWQLQKTQQDMELEQRRRQEQSQFLHMLMHELKTPLAVVSIALGTRNKREANLDLAGRAVQDMKAIIERCIQADRLGDLALDRRRDHINLNACVSQLGAAIPLLQHRLQLQIEPDLTLLNDRQLLQIILSNLLDNAARYSDTVTPVRVSAQAVQQGGEDGIALLISNTPGLAGWPDPEMIFTKYYRSAGAQKDSGSGLGLFLAQQLANSLGGSLRYQPTQRFVEFVLWTPLSPA
jgi:signal transduction histidine kinase